MCISCIYLPLFLYTTLSTSCRRKSLDSNKSVTRCAGEMAKPSETSASWSLSLKVLLISTGVLSMAVVLKLTVPLISQFAISDFPSIWGFFVSWLRPPYLYLIINCIIITIVASSKFQQNSDVPPPEAAITPAPVKITGDLEPNLAISYDVVVPKSTPVEISPEIEYDYDVNVYENVESTVSETKKMMNVKEMDGGGEMRLSEYLLSTEKPPVSARFGHRKAVKASPEGGRTLRVSKPKRHETLESTWKTITDGRPMPLTRHLRKSDTWETHGHHVSNVGHTQDERMRKSETFNVDRSSGGSTNSSQLSRVPSSGKLRREASPSQDELNRRVEAFIEKFNEEMRLQRQESLNQYMEMINRGAH